jgi:hypothetical protein
VYSLNGPFLLISLIEAIDESTIILLIFIFSATLTTFQKPMELVKIKSHEILKSTDFLGSPSFPIL